MKEYTIYYPNFNVTEVLSVKFIIFFIHFLGIQPNFSSKQIAISKSSSSEKYIENSNKIKNLHLIIVHQK